MIGQTISHYKITEKLGEGGMGVVYKAEDTKLDRPVALKFLAPHLVQDDEGHTRFIREAKAAAALNHPNICTIHEIDEVEGRSFIVMEYIQGQNLKDKIEPRPLKLDEALDIAIQATQALRVAHQQRIVHRDIKSANIMVTDHDQVKVMDFGLVQLGGRTKLTKTGTSLGTPAYMSPEQAGGEETDQRTDIWSLGVVVYEMATGQLPFKGEVEAALTYSILNEEPEPLTAVRSGVPLELDRIVSKALAKDPDERYQHVDELEVDLRALQKQLQAPVGKRKPPQAGNISALPAVGQMLGHYKLEAKLGEGGMGTVYRALDTHLDRPVAVKVLRAEAAANEERRKRFAQEAKAASALNHPNIVHIYDIGEAGGVGYIAMEYVAGKTLDSAVGRKGLAFGEALKYAVQITDALAKAHEAGIVHRDVKPGNIMVSTDGLVKVLDFGLAKLIEPSGETSIDRVKAGQQPKTEEGAILGTVAYMSPEQAEGKPVDARSDIFSFGSVLYEMLTGRRAFPGETKMSVLAAILREDPPPISELSEGMPREVERVISRCLRKDPSRRIQHMDDLKLALEELKEESDSGSLTATATPRDGESETKGVGSGSTPARAPARERLAWLIAASCVAGMLALALVYFRQAPPETPQAPLRRFGFTPPVAIGVEGGQHPNIALSPDGNHIVFTARDESRLWIHDLDRGESRPLDGTEGADDPFWSPGSDFIGYFSGAQIRTISARGGVPIRVYQRPGSSSDRGADGRLKGGTWSPDGNSIVFSEDGRLYEIPARGGTPKLLVSPEESLQSSAEPPVGPRGLIRWAHFMPSEAGGRVLVYTFGSEDERTMMVHDLDSGQREPLGPGELVFYSPSGHLLYQAGPVTYDLWALPFSLDTLQATGQAFPIAQNGRLPMVASDGTLVYLDTSVTGQQQLVWLDRRGNKTGEIGQLQELFWDPALSPDGRLVAVTAMRDVWVYDIERGVRTRLSSAPGNDFRPVWSPAGDEVAFTSGRAGNSDIFLRQADGSGVAKVLAATPRNEKLSAWSRDGTYLLYHLDDLETGADLWYLERNEDGSGWEPHPFLQTPFSEVVPRFSPDGRYVAYVSNESGQGEVYVQAFPEGGRKVTVSSNGGKKVRWSRDGKELFYVEGETLVAVSVSTEGDFSVGTATRLFDHPGLTRGSNYAPYDVSADGQRFILAEVVGEGAGASGPSIRVVMNWFAEFRDRERD